MRGLLSLAAVLLLSSGVIACGDAHTGSPSRGSSSATTSAVKQATAVTGSASGSFKGDEDDDDSAHEETPGNLSHDNDSDFDNDYKKQTGYRDGDDRAVTAYGHAAGSADRQAITKLVGRYYAAAGAANGGEACSLMYSTFVRAIPEDYGRGAGPEYARGNTCPEVMTKVFAHLHAQLTSGVTVTSVRVQGDQADALLGSAVTPAGVIRIKREHGAWKIYELLGEPLP